MDLYKAPAAQVVVPDVVPPRPVRGIVLGALADLFLSTVLFVAYALALAAYMAKETVVDTSADRMSIPLQYQDTTLIASYVIGGVASAVGGYVCARYSRIHEYRYGSILAFLMSLLGAFLETDTILLVTGILLTWTAILAGVYWGRLRNLQEALLSPLP